MKYVDEFKDVKALQKILGRIREVIERMKKNGARFPLRIMEICGGQTHSILKYGIHEALPKEVEFIHGPGCPVCVTPIETIDLALAIAKRSNVIFTSFGDMLRVPGSDENMFETKAKGADIRWVYSTLDAVQIAKENPEKEVVFFAIGFETTTAPIAAALDMAEKDGVKNFSLLTAMVKVPPALELLLSDEDCMIDGILAAGHVCTIMGYEEYIPLAEKYRVPIVVTGFQPAEILLGILRCLENLKEHKTEVSNAYEWMVQKEGNPEARKMIEKYFEVIDRKWRGIGTIPKSGFGLRLEYSRFDTEKKFSEMPNIPERKVNPHCGAVLQGKMKPCDCPFFGKECTQQHPIGALMVSDEGACAAYFQYGGLKK